MLGLASSRYISLSETMFASIHEEENGQVEP